jgi:hypothetical protein
MTYLNCYELLKQVRQGLGEFSEALVSGQRPGTHTNDYLIDEINKAQNYLYALALKRMPGDFLGKASLTGVAGVFTLPADFATLLLFQDKDGNQVHRARPDQLHKPAAKGSPRMYYQKQRGLVLDREDVTDTYTLWYRRRPRRIHASRTTAASVSPATDITLGAAAVKIDDYYNGMVVENVTADSFDTITDYVGSTRVATIAVATAKNDYYGLVSDLPEVLHDLIAPKALISIKSTSPLVKARVGTAEVNEFTTLLSTTFAAYHDAEEDVDQEEVFADFGPKMLLGGIRAE